MPRPVVIVAAAALAGLIGPVAVAGCGAQTAKNPSYLLVVLDVPASPSSPPHAARIDIASAAVSGAPQSLCVQLEAPGAATPASFLLQRDFGKDPKPRVTVTVTAFDSLEGGSAGIAGKDFPCPSILPPALAPPQTVAVDFCATKAEKLVFHVGATCCPAPDGGAPDAGPGSDGGDDAGPSDGGAPDSGASDGGASDSGASDGGASDAGGSPDGGSPDAGGGGCGCGVMNVCGAGLGTDGYACAPDACCEASVTTACALEPAQ